MLRFRLEVNWVATTLDLQWGACAIEVEKSSNNAGVDVEQFGNERRVGVDPVGLRSWSPLVALTPTRLNLADRGRCLCGPRDILVDPFSGDVDHLVVVWSTPLTAQVDLSWVEDHLVDLGRPRLLVFLRITDSFDTIGGKIRSNSGARICRPRLGGPSQPCRGSRSVWSTAEVARVEPLAGRRPCGRPRLRSTLSRIEGDLLDC
jgi:hypothetical protein